MRREKLVLFSGYAKLPEGITASEMYKVVAMVVLINVRTGVIMRADCTLATDLARTYVADLIEGENMLGGIEPLLGKIEAYYQGSAKKALITALRIIYDKYSAFREQKAMNED